MKIQTSPFQSSNRIFLVFFITVTILTLSSCAAMMMGAMGDLGGGSSGDVDDFAFEYEETSFSFTILQMNDVYEIAALEEGKVGGMARVATLRNQLIDEGENVLTVLAGDFLSPSLIGTLKYEGERIKGRQMVEVMNTMGVDVVAFGNHEFDLKEHELQARLDESYFDWIGTNVLHKNGRKLEPFFKESYGYKYHIPETYVWEVMDYMSGSSIKIGFISACLDMNQQDWVYYEDPYQEATKAYLELVGEVDIVLGLTHLELEQDLKLATLLPKLPLIMGGHEHENSLDTVGNVVVAKADANAKSVYVHRFTYDQSLNTLQFTSELVQIDNSIPDDPYVAEVVERWAQIQHEKISEIIENPDEIIYQAQEPLNGLERIVRKRQTNLGSLLAAGMASSAKQPVDCAFFNSGSIRLDDYLSGSLTAVDIFRTLPFGGKLYEIDLKGNLLKRALNSGLENVGIGGYLQWHNISYDETNKSWKINGKPLNEKKSYRIITTDYVGEGKEMRLEFLNPKNYLHWETAKEGDTQDLRSDVRKAVINHLKSL